jgi:hypothetical protein
MKLFAGIVFMSLQYVKWLLPFLFLGRTLAHFMVYREWNQVIVKGIAFLITTALIVGMPLGLFELAYPEDIKAFEKSLADKEE